MTYRSEIDGLRAVSVLAVVFYHLGYTWMPGGFVGVDVFFVISGYLITNILIERHETEQVGFADFYLRRLRRLGPALLVMIALSVIAGFFVLAPGDYHALSLSALYALIASSNFYFLYNTGYFDISSQSMPLLHTWSLAIEEQFYLIWPLTLFVLEKACRAQRRRMMLLVAVIAAASFALNVYAVATKEMSGFYLAHDRAWELLVGALIALWKLNRNTRLPQWLSEVLPALGLIAICYAAADFTKSSSYPGFFALLPVLGAAAFLMPIGSATATYGLLGSRIPVLFGKSSYSLYLYHWPILVFWLHYSSFEPMTQAQRLALLVLSCVAGFLSWKYVEEPFRRAKSRWRIAGTAVATGLVIAIGCSFVVARDGLPERIPQATRAISSFLSMWSYEQCTTRPTKAACETGVPWGNAKHRIVLLGDSNAVHFQPLLTAAAEGQDVSIWLLNGCSPIIDGSRTSYYGHQDPKYSQNCGIERDRIISVLRSERNVSLVVIASAWWNVSDHLVLRWFDPVTREEGRRNLKRGMDDLLSDISFVRAPIVLLSAIPGWNINPVPCVITKTTSLLRRACTMETDRFSMEYFNTAQKGASDVFRKYVGQNGIVVSLPEDHVCDGVSCLAEVNGELLYSDQWHLRRNLKPETRREFAKALHFDDIIAAAVRGPVLGSGE